MDNPWTMRSGKERREKDGRRLNKERREAILPMEEEEKRSDPPRRSGDERRAGKERRKSS